MTRFRLTLLAGMLLFANTSFAQPPGPAKDMGEINAVLQDLLKAYTAADLEAITRLMANEVVAYGSVFNANGLDELRTRGGAALRGVRRADVVTKPDVTMSGNLAYVAYVAEVERSVDAGVQKARLR